MDEASAISDQPVVLLERQGGVAFLTLNRPRSVNALSRALLAELSQGLSGLAADPTLTAVVLLGAGDKAFSAGADLKERLAMSLGETRVFLDALGSLVCAIEAFPRPVIAAIAGAALGGGLELALGCDLRIAADNAKLGLPEVRLGILPGAGGTQRLARLCGVAVAKDLILRGRTIDAATALRVGLVSEVVPAAELKVAALRMCADLAAAGPLALAQAKRAIDEGFALPRAEGLAVERACYEIVLASEDRNEGLRAFAERRPPRYLGR